MINQDQTVYDIKNNKINKRMIYCIIDYGLNFEMKKEDKLKLIDKGYELTNNHINRHLEKDKV